MKKVTAFFLVMLFTVISISSCNEDIITDRNLIDQAILEKKAILEANYDERANYQNSSLTTLGKSVLLLLEEKDFKNLVYEEVSKEFDGDYNVLLETIFNNEAIRSRKNDINAILNEGDVSMTVNEALSALDFTDIDSVKYFPQIFIPFFEEHQDQGILNGRTSSTKPIIAIYNGDNAEDLVGYTLRENREFEKLPYLVTEEIALEQEVWVISINENLERNEDIARYETWKKEQNTWVESVGDNTYEAKTSAAPYNICSDGNNVASGRPSSTGIDIHMENFVISSHKEPWHSGKSEVYAKLTTSNGSERLWSMTIAGSYNLPAINVYGDYHLKSVRREDVGCGKYHHFIGKTIGEAVSYYYRNGVTYNQTTAWGTVVWPDRSADDRRHPVCFMVIYERDSGSLVRLKDALISSDEVPGRHDAMTVNVAHQTLESSPYYTTWFTWYQDDVYPCLHYDGPRGGSYDPNDNCNHFLINTKEGFSY